MREEDFNHALTVLVVVRFLRGGLRGVFFVSGGGMRAAGLLGVWPTCATPATPVCGQMRREGVARRRQKPLGRSPGASFHSPLSLAIQRKGARGRRGCAAPEVSRWASLRSALKPWQKSKTSARLTKRYGIPPRLVESCRGLQPGFLESPVSGIGVRTLSPAGSHSQRVCLGSYPYQPVGIVPCRLAGRRR